MKNLSKEESRKYYEQLLKKSTVLVENCDSIDKDEPKNYIELFPMAMENILGASQNGAWEYKGCTIKPYSTSQFSTIYGIYADTEERAVSLEKEICQEYANSIDISSLGYERVRDEKYLYDDIQFIGTIYTSYKALSAAFKRGELGNWGRGSITTRFVFRKKGTDTPIGMVYDHEDTKEYAKEQYNHLKFSGISKRALTRGWPTPVELRKLPKHNWKFAAVSLEEGIPLLKWIKAKLKEKSS